QQHMGYENPVVDRANRLRTSEFHVPGLRVINKIAPQKQHRNTERSQHHPLVSNLAPLLDQNIANNQQHRSRSIERSINSRKILNHVWINLKALQLFVASAVAACVDPSAAGVSFFGSAFSSKSCFTSVFISAVFAGSSKSKLPRTFPLRSITSALFR